MQGREAWVRNGVTILVVFAFSMPAQGAPGDMDRDNDVDRFDFALFHECYMGPQNPVLESACQYARFDADSDVDLRDLARFQASYTGGGACASALAHDCCATPIAVGNGTRSYTNLGATTDGPESTVCDFGFSDFGQVRADVWYCYTASCTGTALASLCGSDYDTKLAVYAGCGCPIIAPLACNDDGCGAGTETFQSRVEFSVTQGQSYMVRVGGYFGDQGDGLLTIGCNLNACGGGGNCFVPSPTGAPGCGDAACCAATCELNQYCCDVTWDANCACEASGICTGSFPACAPGAGLCSVPDTTPGCDNEACCDAVCASDPYCCCTEWDATCVDNAEAMCFLTCGPAAGDRNCVTPHPGLPGCNDGACCVTVCEVDPWCCHTAWDQTCVNEAKSMCPP